MNYVFLNCLKEKTMIDMKELERMGLEAGFTHLALLKSSTIELMPEVREMCEKNTCHM